ncbi:MAG TPA: 1-deoxy-D-xylulose-5-phosphate synthase [Rhodanobacteraceae bacterium]|nr:1-deoxy-D-xylulose-5-phosphate synthase [Rhodanobacteraceae bacterium]
MDTARYPLLAQIDSPADLRRLAEAELPALAAELRAYLIESVARCGGHFGAGLGVVELTVALHYLYDTPRDQLVWDVGHQTYPHKILTGRRDRITSIKRKHGLAPFPRREESGFDSFGVGHASTSISAALGMLLAHAGAAPVPAMVAVIGDGALGGGMAFEALNHAGDIGADLLVVLNDNGMSISENSGALSRLLARAVQPSAATEDGDGGAGRGGSAASFFESLGFACDGPVDGHDLPALLAALRRQQARHGPRLLHVVTTKGKGYAPAEQAQITYHAVGPFDPLAGVVSVPGKPSWTSVFGDWLCDMAAAEPRLRAITPAMREGSGLVRFSQLYPDRYFDVGIAEQHAVTLAAGMACAGVKPVVAIYSTFLQRGFDQLIHDVALQNLPVLFAIDRAGVVGPDGPTHAGSFDLSYLRSVPNMLVMAPSDEAECRLLLSTGFGHDGPAAVRYPRGSGPGMAAGVGLDAVPVGKARWLRRGRGTALLVFGAPLAAAAPVAEELDASLVDMRFVKPLDEALLHELAATHEAFVTIEDNVVAGGAGAGVAEWLAAQGIQMPLLHLGLPDRFLDHASREELLAEAGLDSAGIRRSIGNREAASNQPSGPAAP